MQTDSGVRRRVQGTRAQRREVPERPVLFVSIGWAERYDGTEHIVGNHRWLGENGSNCSEMEAFKEERGRYRCGVGKGAVEGRLDVVFVAREGGTGTRRVVGLYLDATTGPWLDGGDWQGAFTRKAYRFPVGERLAVSEWPGHMGVRRWAYRGALGGAEHRALLDVYRKALAKLGSEHVPRSTPVDGEHDEELAAFEGEARPMFILHRSRERTLRNAKLAEVFRETGRLACQVPGCGFDFHEVYGELGHSFAHVHHTKPLAALKGKTKVPLSELAVVCANCHAMIHRGGACRRLHEVAPRERRART